MERSIQGDSEGKGNMYISNSNSISTMTKKTVYMNCLKVMFNFIFQNRRYYRKGQFLSQILSNSLIVTMLN